MIEIWTEAKTRARNAQADFQQVTRVPALVRVGVLVACSGALLLAYPPILWLQVLALFPALFPRSMAATAFIIVTCAFWAVSTAAEPDRLSLWRLCALAIVLYLVHIGCALSSVLPYNAVTTAGVLRPWLIRAGAVSVLTVAVGTFVVALPRVITAGQPLLAATLGGIVLMITTAIFIAYLGNRRQ